MAAKVLKLPIVKKGEWKHGKYGDVKFDQADLDMLVDGFKTNARGYQPYLRYGHLLKGTGLKGGEPAQARLTELKQEGDVLYGLFKPNNENVVGEVEREEYLYGSAEIGYNVLDKKTNKRIPILLKGHSLTNEPFIPDLPPNQVLDGEAVFSEDDESSIVQFTMKLSDEEVQLSDWDELHPPYCKNCGNETTGDERFDSKCPGFCASCIALMAPRKDEEKTMLQKMMQTMKNVASKVESFDWRLDSMRDRIYSLEVSPTPTIAVFSEEETPGAPEAPETPPSPDDVVPPIEGVPPEAPAPDAEPTPDPDPAIEAPDEEIPPTMTPEEIKKLQDDLAAAEAAKLELEATVAAAKEATDAAQKALADKEAAEAAEKEAREAAEKEAKETAFEKVLTDMVEEAVAKGVKPAKAAQALAVVKHFCSADERTIVLSDSDEQQDIPAIVFGLLNQGEVDFIQHGDPNVTVHLTEDDDTDNPLAGEIAAARAKRAELDKAARA